MEPDNGVRLNKFLSEAGVCSRREADRLIEEGRVTVDGCRALTGMRVQPNQKVEVDSKRVTGRTRDVILAVNKPQGVVCTTDTRWGDVTLEQMVSYPTRVFSIGRLDKRSEGLILMTDNGDIVNRMMRAENAHEKEYLVTIDKPVTEDFLSRMREGVELEELGVRTMKAKAWKVDRFRFRIILKQGLNRQIRRMCEACGCQVTKLVRTRIMNIELGDLGAGTWRELTKEEKEALTAQLYPEKPGKAPEADGRRENEPRRI